MPFLWPMGREAGDRDTGVGERVEGETPPEKSTVHKSRSRFNFRSYTHTQNGLLIR